MLTLFLCSLMIARVVLFIWLFNCDKANTVDGRSYSGLQSCQHCFHGYKKKSFLFIINIVTETEAKVIDKKKTYNLRFLQLL